MGGILIIFAVVLSTLLWADMTNRYVWLVVAATVGFGAVGFADDCQVHQASIQGLSAAQKFTGQFLVALAIGVFLYTLPSYTTKLSVPFFKFFTPDLGWFYIVFVILVIVGSSNAVNLTDGLDGLAIGPVMIASLAYTIVAYVTGNRVMAEYLLIPYIEGAGEIAIFTRAILGSSLGFLWFNTYPASVFMGMSARCSLGAALGTVAAISNTNSRCCWSGCVRH